MRKKLTAALATAVVVGSALVVSSASAFPPASHLHTGEYCSMKHSYQRFYHRHGYTCRRDGSSHRLFDLR